MIPLLKKAPYFQPAKKATLDMNFSHSSKTLELMSRVQKFMDEEVTPNEALYFEHLVSGEEDWTNWKVPPSTEEHKAKEKGPRLRKHCLHK